ncbi:MAG TPA: hypothetical protein VEW48_06890 [Thermoanaerobaculia bacterium]|nr:hypothetical protein [Thermoanaerobaculia bacterium]
MKKVACALSFLLSLSSMAAQAGVQPSGAEFHPGVCADCSKRAPAVAGAKTGESAVAWSGTSGADAQGILARFYNKTGAVRGGQLQVNKLVPPDQDDAAVAFDPSGNTFIAWSELTEDNSEIFVQRYNTKGKALGTPIKVSVDDPAAPAIPLDVFPSIAATPDGGFAVAWIKAVPPSDADRIPPVVMFRSFNKSAAPLINPTQLSTGLVRGLQPGVCVSSSGQAVVVWTNVDEFRPFQPNHKGVSMRRIAKTGVVTGPEAVVVAPISYEIDADVSCGANGTFVVIWHTNKVPAVDGVDILGQRYTALGRKTGAIFRVNSVAAGDQRDPAIAHDAAGNFVVVWESRGSDATGRIVGRRFKANGTADGADFVVHAQGEDEPMPGDADVAFVGASGDFLVVWLSGPEDVVGRRYKTTSKGH